MIEARNMHWLSNTPAAQDLCVHGGAVVRVDDVVLVDDTTEEWALSAGALYLLRTLEHDHTPDSPVAEHLLPHCGHAMYAETNSEDVTIVGCPHGRNWRVVHEESSVVLDFDGGLRVTVPRADWRDAVVHFADAVQEFYATSEPKAPMDQVDATGFAAFQKEWKRRVDAARHAV
jgi:hypothetical protein